MFPLFADLKGMGENSAAINRKLHLHRLVHPKSSPQKDTNQFNLLLRETLLAANAIYEELYGEAGQEGQGQAAVVLPATFQVCIGFCRTLWVPTLLLLFLFPFSFPFSDRIKDSQPPCLFLSKHPQHPLPRMARDRSSCLQLDHPLTLPRIAREI